MRIIASFTNKCRQLIFHPIVYVRKSTTHAVKPMPFVHVCCIVFLQNDFSVMSIHKACRKIATDPELLILECLHYRLSSPACGQILHPFQDQHWWMRSGSLQLLHYNLWISSTGSDPDQEIRSRPSEKVP